MPTETKFQWEEVRLENGDSEWIVYEEEGTQWTPVARDKDLNVAIETALEKSGYKVLDKAPWPPGKIADFKFCKNFVRNVAVLRTGLHSLYKEVKALESELSTKVHVKQELDVNGIFALLAVKFDWFSISMLNLMEGISLLHTLVVEGSYNDLTSSKEGMKLIQSLARDYTKSIPEAEALRLWRDKVAAHRSGIHPPPRGKPSDPITTKYISMMGAQVKVKNRRYVAPSFTFVNTAARPIEHGLVEWSLTETWESLARERYVWLNDGNFFKEVNGINL